VTMVVNAPRIMCIHVPPEVVRVLFVFVERRVSFNARKKYLDWLYVEHQLLSISTHSQSPAISGIRKVGHHTFFDARIPGSVSHWKARQRL